MWGATDVAYVLWLCCKLTHVPLHERLMLVLTVCDVHLSSSVLVFMGSIGFRILVLLRPDWAATDDGLIAVLLQRYLTLCLVGLTALTAFCYEFYAQDLLAAVLRSGPPSAPPPTSGAALSAARAERLDAAAAAAAAVAVSARAEAGAGAAGGAGGAEPEASSGGASAPPAPGALLLGAHGEPLLSPLGGRRPPLLGPHTSGWFCAYLARLSGWVWSFVVAILYLLLPACWAQTKMIFTDRLKLHVSPKSSPVPGAPTPLGGGMPPGHAPPQAAAHLVAVSLATGDVSTALAPGGGAGGGGGGGGGGEGALTPLAGGQLASARGAFALAGGGSAGGGGGGVAGGGGHHLALAAMHAGGGGANPAALGVGLGVLKAHLVAHREAHAPSGLHAHAPPPPAGANDAIVL